jgi:hypothetical protein
MATTALQVITDVRRELVETVAAFWSDAELLRALNRGVMDFANKTRCLEDIAFMNSVVGRNDYPLPDNFLSAKLVLHNVPDSDGNAHWKRIMPSNLEKFAQQRVNFLSTATNTLGRPQEYMIWNNVLYLNPAPSAANSSNSDVYLYYKSKPTTITDTNDQIALPDELVEAVNEYMLWKAFAKEQEEDLATQHMQNYVAYVKEGRKWVKKQSGDQRNRFDIESQYGFYGAALPSNPLDL